MDSILLTLGNTMNPYKIAFNSGKLNPYLSCTEEFA